MAQLRLYNSLTNKKEEFLPIDQSHVRVYTCGPTVYNYAHIGNARPPMVSDVLVRLLRYLYPRVTYVSNITDIDDKIINASIEQDISISTLTKKYENIYNENLKELGILYCSIFLKIKRLSANFSKASSELIFVLSKFIKKKFAVGSFATILFSSKIENIFFVHNAYAESC